MYEAHGLGGGADLPIPAEFAIVGGAAALAVSFVVLLWAWRTPRFDDHRHERPVPPALARVLDGRVLAVVLRILGLALAGFAVWAAVAGPDLTINPALGIVFVWLWVGVVPASLLFGRFYRAVSPVRTLHLLIARAIGSSPGQGLREYPAWLGYWPGAIGLLAFVWYELVYPSSTEIGPLRLWFAIYLGVLLLGAAVFGDDWLERADPFEVYSDLLAHLSPWSRSAEGRLVLVSPLRNLARLRPGPGTVAVVAVLLGSTAWDSFRESLTWIRFVESNDLSVTLLSTVMLVLVILVVGGTYAVATMATRAPGDADRATRRRLPLLFAHSIVPIIVGYMVAHYLTYFVEYGQAVLAHVSDPLGTGADLFGTADREVNYWLSYHPTLLASIKVLAIVVGHVVGAVAAHDRALRVLPERHRVSGQLPLLAAMVCYTFAGLYLLFGA